MIKARKVTRVTMVTRVTKDPRVTSVIPARPVRRARLAKLAPRENLACPVMTVRWVPKVLTAHSVLRVMTVIEVRAVDRDNLVTMVCPDPKALKVPKDRRVQMVHAACRDWKAHRGLMGHRE